MPVTKKRNHFLFPGMQTTSACEHTDAEKHYPQFDSGVDAVFVNVPYCRVKCHHCPFFSSYLPNAKVRASEFDTYFDAVARHLDLAVSQSERAWPGVGNGRVPLYIGGGTPTVVGTGHIGGILGRVRAAGFDLSEITVEGNPEDVTYPYVESMLDLGVTRMSLGVQSTNPRLLHRVGSPHTVEDTEMATAAMRAYGMPYNVDLLYGLPAQNLADLDRQLEWVTGTAPTSVTWYPYSYDPEGILRLDRGRTVPTLPIAPGGNLAEFEDASRLLVRQMYLHIRDVMTGAGYTEGMIGAFYRAPGPHVRAVVRPRGPATTSVRTPTTTPTTESLRVPAGEPVNESGGLQYGRRAYQYGGGILGLGARAYTFTGRRVSQAGADPHRYVEDIAAGRLAQRCTGDLSDRHLLIRSSILSLMYGELREPELAAWQDHPEGKHVQAELEDWQNHGLASVIRLGTSSQSGDWMRLSDQGKARIQDLLDFFWTLA